MMTDTPEAAQQDQPPTDGTNAPAPAVEPQTAGVATAEPVTVPVMPEKKWYVVKVQSGREDTIREALEQTSGGTTMALNVAFNYSGRSEIVDAARRALADGLAPADLDEDEPEVGVGALVDVEVMVRGERGHLQVDLVGRPHLLERLALDRVRRIVGELRFILGVQLIEAATDPLDLSEALCRTAEAAIEVLAAADLKPHLPGLARIALARPSLNERCELLINRHPGQSAPRD